MASLDILLSANADAFTKGIDGAIAKIGTMVDSVIPGAGKIANAFISIGGAIEKFAMPRIDAMFQSMKLGERLGLAGDEMGAFRVIAAKTGSDVESVIRPMERMGALIGEAGLGNQAAIETFSLLGLNFVEMGNKTKPEQLIAIGKALDGIANVNSREDMSKKLFGRGFGETKAMIKEMSTGFEDAKGTASALGIGGKSAADKEAIVGAKIAVDELDLAWGGVLNTVATAFAPMIKEVALWLTGAVKAIGAIFGPTLKGIGSAIGSAFSIISPVVRLLMEGFAVVGDIVSGVLAPAFGAIGLIFKGIAWVIEDIVKSIEWAADKARILIDSGGAITNRMVQDVIAKQGGIEAFRKQGGAQDLLAKGNTSESPKAAQEMSKEAFEIIADARRQNPVVEKLENIQEKIDRTNELLGRWATLFSPEALAVL